MIHEELAAEMGREIIGQPLVTVEAFIKANLSKFVVDIRWRRVADGTRGAGASGRPFMLIQHRY